ncbi:hypothetical protein [Halorussus sp. MSC15.2]|uniref:hypothetical protein n=1 Tax=Halorussus sp. MSC15.2 TaxID=2283638 RepID=UPI001F076EDF|nr:hypothetical protein [Halorussus sp. MSC15.2]
MVRAIRVALCCLLVASLAWSVVPSTAAPPPRPLCDACGESFEATAASEGVTLSVERSTATLTVHGNGSATWVVRNRLADSEGVERLRENAGLRTDVADRAMWDTEFLGASVSSAGVLTARYREPNFAERSVGGVLRSGAFTEAYGYRNLDGLGADRLVVVAPDGMRVGRTVPGATVSADGRRTTLTEFDDGGFVTFVPADTALEPVSSALAIWSLLGPVVGTNLLLYAVLPASVFGLLVAALGAGISRFRRNARSSATPSVSPSPSSACWLQASRSSVAVSRCSAGRPHSRSAWVLSPPRSARHSLGSPSGTERPTADSSRAPRSESSSPPERRSPVPSRSATE